MNDALHLLIEDTICVRGSRANAEQVPLESGGIIVHVVELGASLIPACDHGAHTQTITAILKPDRQSMVEIRLHRMEI